MSFKELIRQLESHSNKTIAQKMEAYMKNHFQFYGIPSPERKQVLQNWKAENSQWREVKLKEFFSLFKDYKRECTYCSMELLIQKLRKNYEDDHYCFITQLIVTNSWWDSVDSIASNLLGGYMQSFPEKIPQMIDEYDESGNIWLQRSTLIFQLKYKDKTDAQLLFEQCLKYQDSQEFFIQKAMGWALREYAKVNPKSVYNFVDQNTLPNLTKREATKHRNSE